MQLGDVLAQLEELTKAELATSAESKERVEAAAKQGAEYARSIAPVGDREHRVGNTVDEPGDYQRSIEGTAVFEDGAWKGRVIARDYKAHWIEYGTEKMPKQAVLRRTRSHVEGDGS